MKKKIAVFENDDALLELLLMILNEAGYEAIGTATEDQFFKLIEHKHTDAILLDVVQITPIGLKLCNQLKQHPEYGSIPIIVLSTHRQVAAAKEVCATEIVEKPFDIDHLLLTLREQLSV